MSTIARRIRMAGLTIQNEIRCGFCDTRFQVTIHCSEAEQRVTCPACKARLGVVCKGAKLVVNLCECGIIKEVKPKRTEPTPECVLKHKCALPNADCTYCIYNMKYYQD